VEGSAPAPGAGLRAYETMIAVHAISHKSGDHIAELLRTGVVLKR
jgi:hypothetical protein